MFLYARSKSDCFIRANRDEAHGNLPSVTRISFPVRDTESDPRWGMLGLACETNKTPGAWLSAPPTTT